MRSNLFKLFVVVFLIAFSFTKTQAAVAKKITYKLQPTQTWKLDTVTEAPAPGYEHYNLKADDSIDLLFSFADQDLYSELKKDGPEKVSQEILKGKNLIQNLVSDAPVQMSKVKVTDEKDRKILSFETTYMYGKVKYYTIENFYLYQGKGFHSVLRWNQKSDTKLLNLAKKDFQNIAVQQTSGAEK